MYYLIATAYNVLYRNPSFVYSIRTITSLGKLTLDKGRYCFNQFQFKSIISYCIVVVEFSKEEYAQYECNVKFRGLSDTIS